MDEFGNHEFQDRLEDAKVVIIDDENEMSELIPTFNEAVLYEEDFDDYDEDDSGPAHRRRVGDADDSASVSDEDTRAVENDKRKKKREANLRIEQYSSKARRAGSSSWLMFSLAVQLGKDTNEILWWGILGVTEQYLHAYIGDTEYESAFRTILEEVTRLNPEDSRQGGNVGRITFVQDFKFMLLRYWTLYESMYYSDYIATNLQLWKDRKNDSNQLRTLLSKMGIPLVEAEQKFICMKSNIQDDLSSKLEYWSKDFKISCCEFPTFHKSRHLAHHISAADCVHVTSALLNRTYDGSNKWADGFYKAYDALQVLI
jgi:cell division control protein 45